MWFNRNLNRMVQPGRSLAYNPPHHRNESYRLSQCLPLQTFKTIHQRLHSHRYRQQFDCL